MTYPAKIRRWALTGIAVIAGILVACVAAELLLRIVYPPSGQTATLNDSETGLLYYEPGSSFAEISPCIDNTVSINNLGFHGPAIDPQKASDVYRILVVGSSFVEADTVPVPQMFTTLLEEKLNSDPGARYTYAVIPVGFSGNGTYLDILYFLRWGAPLKPDLVIDLTTEYEIGKDAGGGAYTPSFGPTGALVLSLPKVASNGGTIILKTILRQSRLISLLYDRALLLAANKSAFFAAPGFSGLQSATTSDQTDISSSGSLEEKLLVTFAQQARGAGASFLLASWMTPQASTSTARVLHDDFVSAAAQGGFPYVDLSPPIASSSQATGESPVWSCDDHWSPAGNEFAADALYQYLEAHPMLIQ
jgi:hypothetical protein